MASDRTAEPPASLVRTSAAEPWPEEAKVVREFLRDGVQVAFCFTAEDLSAWFTLRPARGAIAILDGAGRHVGTYADAAAAIACGWGRGGWGV